jgi:hypothetical protein
MLSKCQYRKTGPRLHTSYCNVDILSSDFDVASTCSARAAVVAVSKKRPKPLMLEVPFEVFFIGKAESVIFMGHPKGE